MITKERLEELIEKGATIYSNEYGEIQLIKENDLSLYENGQNNYILYALEPNKKYHNEIFDEDLFETKEDAEFAYKYQNISRLDSLNLPTYEDFVKNYQSFGDDLIPDEKCVIFTCKDGVYSLYACDNEIWVGKDSDGSVMFHKELNKENYIRACDICVKLFKGEEV